MITVKYSDNHTSQFVSWQDIIDYDNIDCSYNQLTLLPSIMKLSNLEAFDCSNNQLTHMAAIIGV